MSVDFQQTTHSYIPEDGTLYRQMFSYELHCHVFPFRRSAPELSEYVLTYLACLQSSGVTLK
jgi:hypothetical protein